jgi:sugar/nucleoside kinase (ribokinase family)
MEKCFDVVVAGHLCLDLLPQMDHLRLADLTTPGHLFETGPMRFSTGGAVSNTGLALHRLGVDVRLMSNVGDDLIGQMIVSFLKSRDPLLTQHIQEQKGSASAYTVVLAPEKVDRIFLHCTGTNATFTSADIDYEQVTHAKIFHLGYPPLLPALTNNSGKELALLFQNVKAASVITSLDTSLPDPDGASGRVDWQVLLQNTLPFVDIFVPSIDETLFMLRRQDYDRWGENCLEHLSHSYLRLLANQLLDMGAAVVGFKLGELGIYLQTGNTKNLERLSELPITPTAWANQQVWHPAFAVDVIGTTGAGDSAYAGLLSAMLHGMSIGEAAQWACAVGACNVEAADATSGVQSWEATSSRIYRGWSTNTHRLPAE